MNQTPAIAEQPVDLAAISPGLLSLEHAWRGESAMEAIRCRVTAQASGILFPELAACADSGRYFLHIPKTAGTSTNRFFDNLGLHANTWLWDQMAHLERTGCPVHTAFYSGHFHMHLEPYLGRKLTRLTMLRDPVARTISHYQHVRRHPQHPAHDIAQHMDLKEFCINPRTRHMVENYQARYLVDFGLDPRSLGAVCTQEDLSNYLLQDMLEKITRGVVAPDLLYAAAAENLNSFAAVGTTEEFPVTMERFAAALGFQPPPRFDERHNTAGNSLSPSDLDADTLGAVCQATEVDQALHRLVQSQSVPSPSSTS